MNFGKLHDVSQVDFMLPSDSPRTERVLQHSAKTFAGPVQIFLGATGWSNPEWVGKWYPPRTKPTDYLQHYSRIFNTIEFNTTHYRIPQSELVERWEGSAAVGFAFCPKIPQQISHRAKLKAEEPTLRFVEAIAAFKAKLGPCFIQLPDHHGPRELDLIQHFIETWPREVALQWEVRHPDWYAAAGGNAGEYWDSLEANGHGTVITDVAGRRDVLHMTLTTPVLMLRFVGNGLRPSDYARADAWIARIQAWAGAGLQKAFIFIHQPEMDQVPGFTGYWAQGLNRALGLSLHVPEPLPTTIQGTLF